MSSAPTEACPSCGASMAADQLYCLSCGSRKLEARSQSLTVLDPLTMAPASPARSQPAGSRLTLLAALAVLLLAIGLGVLIGHETASANSNAGATKTVTVRSDGTGSTGAPSRAGHSGGSSASGKGEQEAIEAPDVESTG